MLFPILYEVDDGLYTIAFVNTGTLCALVETDNKQAALEKQDDRHLDDRAPDECPHLWAEQPESLEDWYVRQERLQETRAAMRCLTRTQMRRLYLHFYEQLSTRKIALIEGISQRVVARSIHEGLKKLRKFLLEGSQNGF